MVCRTHNMKISVLVKSRLLSLNGQGATAKELANYLNNNNFGFSDGVTPGTIAAIINRRSKVSNDILECVQVRKKFESHNHYEYFIPKGAK